MLVCCFKCSVLRADECWAKYGLLAKDPFARLVLMASCIPRKKVKSMLQLRLQMGWSVEGQARVQRHAAAHVPRLSALLLQHHTIAHSAVLQQVRSALKHAVKYTRIVKSPAECTPNVILGSMTLKSKHIQHANGDVSE